jgi:hypothetical protein
MIICKLVKEGMKLNRNLIVLLFLLTFLGLGSANTQPEIPIDMAFVQPGTQVAFKGEAVNLLGPPGFLGKPMKNVDLSKETGSIPLLSTIADLDTLVSATPWPMRPLPLGGEGWVSDRFGN